MDNSWLSIFGGFAGIGVLAAGIGFAYAQFKSGVSKAKDDLIDTLKETAGAERTEKERLAVEKTTLVKNHQEQLNALNAKIGRLEGLLEASEKRMTEYMTILQGRNPEQQKFMELVTKTIADSSVQQEKSAKWMSDTAGVLEEIKTFMALMNGEIAKGNLFNKQISDDTKHGEGEILRKKV